MWFGPSAVLKQIVRIHCAPKSVRIRHTALMDSKQSSQKNYGKRSRTAKFRRKIQDSDPKACPNPQEIIGLYLQIAKLDQNLSESSCLETRGFGLNKCLKSQAIFGSVLSDCKNSQMWTENCPIFQNYRGCVPLQNALENSTICMQYLPNSARKSNNCTYKVQKPLP